jgi:APA family basic amino acid/polyamine antiporter
MIAYTGIETISNMAEEARDETTTIPRAINRVVIAVFAIYAALPAVALSALPVTQNPETGEYETKLGLPEEEGGYAGDPILGVVQQIDLGAFQDAAEIYVGLLAATILFIATNAGIIGVSRLVYSMGIHRQMPDRLRQLHPRYGTPWIGIIVFGGGASCLAILPGQADFLGNIYAFGAMLSFSIAHLAVIRLRVSHPEVERPFRGPLNARIFGVDFPVFAAIGLFGTSLAFVVVTVLNVDVAIAGAVWLAIGCVVYVLFRRRHGLSLTETTKVAVPKPVVDQEAEYDSVLVVLDLRGYSPGAVATAVRLAARRRRGIHVLVPITVPASSPLDAAMPEQEGVAQTIIEQARLQGGRRVTGHLEKVRAGQAGRLIVEEAKELRATAIVMPLPPRQAGSVRAGLSRRGGHSMTSVSGRDAHRRFTTLTSAVLVILGVAMIVRTIAAGGGPLSLGILLGVLFVLAGAGRIAIARGMRG